MTFLTPRQPDLWELSPLGEMSQDFDLHTSRIQTIKLVSNRDAMWLFPINWWDKYSPKVGLYSPQELLDLLNTLFPSVKITFLPKGKGILVTNRELWPPMPGVYDVRSREVNLPYPFYPADFYFSIKLILADFREVARDYKKYKMGRRDIDTA